MNETKLDWNDLQLFLAVARNGGLSGAARETGSSAPTLGRRMHALELATGKELFQRHARGYDLTEQGSALLEATVDLAGRIKPLTERAEGADKLLVKVSAGSWTTRLLCQNIARITDRAPGALLRFISANQYLNIHHRETVIGIRNERPQQTGVAYRRIGQVQFAGYARSAKVRPWIRVVAQTPSARWLAAQQDVEIAMEVNNAQIACELAMQGTGRVVLPCFVGDAEASLQRVTDPIEALSHDQWLVGHHEDRYLRPVRQVMDEIHGVLRAQLRAVEGDASGA